jgi:ABC-type molybdenum transport system ATPase subunit/photorepair protein PhrA
LCLGGFVVKIFAVKAVLETSNLKIQRGGVAILDGVNWRVRRGEHWVTA